MNPVAAAIFAATIAGVIARQVVFRGPPVWAIFLAGALAMVASGTLPVDGAATALDVNLPVLVFLFSLFVMVAGLEQAGALEHLAAWVVGRARRPADLPFLLFVSLGSLSAFVVNDALVLVGVPLLLAVGRRIRTDPLPLLLTLAFSVSVGSALTPFGNPQNLLVSLGSGMNAPITTFLRYLLLPTALNLALGGLYLGRVFGPELAHGTTGTAAVPLVPRLSVGGLVARIVRSPAVVIFPATLVAMIGFDSLSAVGGGPSVPMHLLALGGAVAVLVLSPGRVALFGRVNWPILVLFASLFVFVGGLVDGGVVPALVSLVPIPGPGGPNVLAALLATAVGGSQLVSNVPWVGLQLPLMHAVGFGPGDPIAWVALAAGSTLAGNVTLIGAASNLIVAEQSERAGIRIGLWPFIKAGAPLAAMTLGILWACLALGL